MPRDKTFAERANMMADYAKVAAPSPDGTMFVLAMSGCSSCRRKGVEGTIFRFVEL